MGEERPPIIFYAFDLLRLNGENLQSLPMNAFVTRSFLGLQEDKAASEVVRGAS